MQDYNGSHVLRLIDCIGKQTDLGRITRELDILLESLGCEYIDMYETGLNDAMLLSAGWKKAEDDGNIIPDYFYPFEQRKVDIHYSSSNQSVVLFKGDGDQDRPN